MPISIALSFPSGRYHATPWGRHVNEGVPEWPPSPWRLLRALAATWKRKLVADALVNQHIETVLSQLSAPPIFRLPAATVGHTRHYMPWYKKGPTDRTLVFDTFVALEPYLEVGFHWPEFSLTAPAQEALARVLTHLNFFGRAESWCEARLFHDWNSLSGAVCSWLDSVTGEIGPDLKREGYDPVRVLCADTTTPGKTWKDWNYSKDAGKPHPKWNLLAETKDLHVERWSDPPGSKWLTYYRPRDAFAVKPSRKRDDATAWFGQWGIEPETTPAVARFALDGSVLPRVQDTVYVGEIARRYVQGIHGNRRNKASSLLFSGKEADGEKREGHAHAFYLPLDADNDGRLDELLIVAPEGLTLEELKTLSAFRKMHGPSGIELNILLLEVCALEKALLAQSARLWRSVTPFIAMRHYKERGTKRDTFPRERLAEMNLREELAQRGFPAPVNIRPVTERELPKAGRKLPWREFRQYRVMGDGRRGNDFGKGFEIEFAEPVSGPLALGYACHFGLGLFVPA